MTLFSDGLRAPGKLGSHLVENSSVPFSDALCEALLDINLIADSQNRTHLGLLSFCKIRNLTSFFPITLRQPVCNPRIVGVNEPG